MINEATGMDLIITAQGRNRISKRGKRPASAPSPTPAPSPSRKPATIFRSVNQTVDQKPLSCQRVPRRSSTDSGVGIRSCCPTLMAVTCQTASASSTAPRRCSRLFCWEKNCVARLMVCSSVCKNGTQQYTTFFAGSGCKCNGILPKKREGADFPVVNSSGLGYNEAH